MTYQRKTDNPKAGRPKQPPKETLTIRVPVDVMETLRLSGKPKQVAVQALRVGLDMHPIKARSIG